MSETITLDGTVRHVFAHRFTLEAEGRTHLADLGPRGAERLALVPGDRVAIAGERKPSEIKVARISRGGETVVIAHGDKYDHAPADPAIALKTARDAGLTPLGEPRRKPKHVEILGRDPNGGLQELHVELDGSLRKRRPDEAGDGKCAETLAAI